MSPWQRPGPSDALAPKPPYEQRAGVECRIAGHKAIADGRENGQRGVAMFRSSIHRLRSAYGHGKHAFGTSVGRLVGWVGRLAGRLVGWLVGGWVGGLVGRSVGWLVDWLVG